MADEEVPKYINVSYGPAPDEVAGPVSCPAVDEAPRDIDDVIIPKTWWHSPRWMKLPLELRKRWSKEWVKDQERYYREELMMKPKPARGPAPKFSTQYAVDYGKKQKKESGLNWQVIDRERFVRAWNPDSRDRHHDLMLGLDVLFDDGRPGMVGVQAAGKGERAVHYKRFEERGGIELAKRRNIRVYYWVFERGNKTPIETERWA